MNAQLNDIVAQQHVADLVRVAEHNRIARLASGNPAARRWRLRIGRGSRRRELLVGSS
jgi:hypothetical protein